MLIDIRIICAFEARDTAQKLQRLLSAEGHKAEISSGRDSISEIAISRARREAVVVLWSEKAQAAQFPAQWAQATEPARLIELAFCNEWPPLKDRAEVIDFTHWRGVRGEGACWRSLQERLKAAAKIADPPKPQPRAAALVLVAASLAAAGAAVWARIDAQHAPLEPVQEASVGAPLDDQPISSGTDAQGGPLTLSEPEDFSEAIAAPQRLPRVVFARPARPLPPARFAPSYDFREPGLMQRLLGREQDDGRR
jgi:hypothetical protein